MLSFSNYVLWQQTSGAAGYSKFVSREMSKAEALLKVSDLVLYDCYFFNI